jgi:hypothetical protein
MSEWISIKDRLPKYEERVLVNDDGYVRIAELTRARYAGGMHRGEEVWDSEDESAVCFFPTHWMVIPDPPKESE